MDTKLHKLYKELIDENTNESIKQAEIINNLINITDVLSRNEPNFITLIKQAK